MEITPTSKKRGRPPSGKPKPARTPRHLLGNLGNHRPTVLTPDLTRLVCTAIQSGCHVATAGVLAGVTRQTIFNWRRRGTAALEREANGEPLDEGEKPFAAFAFAFAVDVAEARLECRLFKAMDKLAMAGKFKALAFILERRFPEHWSPRAAATRIDEPWPEPAPPPIVIPATLEGRRAGLLRIMAKWGCNLETVEPAGQEEENGTAQVAPVIARREEPLLA